MTVFVITEAFDFAGESPLGVAASLDLAKAIAEKRATHCGYTPETWVTVLDRLELQFGATQYVVREQEVQA